MRGVRCLADRWISLPTASAMTETATGVHRLRRKAEATDARRAKLRAMRSRLTQGDGVDPDVDYDLTLMFVRNELAARGTIPVLAMILALASMMWAPMWQAALWLVIVLIAKVILIETCRAFANLAPGEVKLPHWHRRLILAEALFGVALAGFALIGLEAGGDDPWQAISSHVFLFAALIVVLAIRMTFAATLPMVLYVGTLPMTFAIVLRLVIQGDLFYLALAAMAIGIHLYFLFLARGLNTTARAMLAFKAQKDLLIADLEEAKLISDEARRRAEAANMAKSRFLATMSHELRTPLNAILGFSEVMTQEILGPLENQTYREYADNIHRSGAHLLHLINEILDLSRIEAGRYELNEDTIHLADILQDAHSLLKLRAETKSVEIIEAFESDLPPVWADERAIRQIVLNLLSNAVKFTPRGGTITLALAMLDSGEQVFSVRDTGPGIPAEELPKVLEAFGQGSLAHQTAEGGTGLGLPIVSNLIELHGGNFDLESELRKGTEAIITIPASRVLRAMPPLQPLGVERHNPQAPAPKLQNFSTTRPPRLIARKTPYPGSATPPPGTGHGVVAGGEIRISA